MEGPAESSRNFGDGRISLVLHLGSHQIDAWSLPSETYPTFGRVAHRHPVQRAAEATIPCTGGLNAPLRSVRVQYIGSFTRLKTR